MIEFNSGNYTIYNNKVCKLYELRSEVLLKKDELQYTICYDASHNFNFDGFYKHEFEDMYCKNFFISEITNAFFAQTVGIYNGEKVNVFEYLANPTHVYIVSKDKTNIEKNSFVDMGDHCAKEVKVLEIERLWEERSPCQFDIPMPKGLELIKEFELPKS